MKPRSGQVLVEATLILPLVVICFYFLGQVLLISISKSLMQWAAFSAARNQICEEASIDVSKNMADAFLAKIPFRSQRPWIEIQDTPHTVHVQIRQSIQILGFQHVLRTKTALYK